jgi:uncharacterized coiled-coil protein SlyX
MADASSLERLESLLMHLQRDFESLNAVVLDQQRQLTRLQQVLTRVDNRLNRLSWDEEQRDPEAERPPHY